MSSRRAFICGLDKKDCIGSTFIASSGLRGHIRAHNLPGEAFDCKKKYLLREGYEQIGPREFIIPEDKMEPGRWARCLVLTKRSRFGAACRAGKAGESTGKMNSPRRMPAKRTGGYIAML